MAQVKTTVSIANDFESYCQTRAEEFLGRMGRPVPDLMLKFLARQILEEAHALRKINISIRLDGDAV